MPRQRQKPAVRGILQCQHSARRLADVSFKRHRIAHLPQLWTAEDVERSLIFFAAFMLIDLLTCVIAFALERHEDWTLLAPILLQRFYYRQMMYLVLFRALREAVQGRAVGWRGVEPELPTPATTG